MFSSRFFVVTATAVVLAVAPAFGEAAPARVRGTLTAINDGGITVKEKDGRTVTLKTGQYTTYADVIPSSLAEIKVNDFVGSAVKGPPNSLVAVELAIIPDSMRAGRIGYYGWDPLPDPTAVQATRANVTGITNGRVSNVLPTAPKLTNTNMTNGIVSAEQANAAGRTLTVTYDGGSKRLHITVPPNAPIVRYVLTDRSAAFIGSTVFIKTIPGNRAGLVTIGNGVTPPM
ncbi:metal ABC transporter permease [Paraburkholderia humisilvae]|uniref:DUF5666 domain-containing protein n=1 Tax=Paraburkholderia humisilvae TaxID=627669 RepID=A0A6J5EKY1_9BURK|nr:metal ABC transporter permease [Paraburkholderia humisilvae]CAB3767179.1 hypothetical protein LMG29542_05528 [Paraburkholderia humisilvae]